MFSGRGLNLIKFSAVVFPKSFNALNDKVWSNWNPLPKVFLSSILILLYSDNFFKAASNFLGLSLYASYINALALLTSSFSKPEFLKFLSTVLKSDWL